MRPKTVSTMKKTITTIILLFIFASTIIVSCKKDKKEADAIPTPVPNYTKAEVTSVTIISIPNSSLFYDANGADIYIEYFIFGLSSVRFDSPILNVQDNQFPLIINYSGNFNFYKSGYAGSTGNYSIKIFDEDINNDGQASDQEMGTVNLTWSELLSNTSSITKINNGTTIKINYTLK
jgi:hypothetical protein